MTTSPHKAHDYAELIRARLPHQLQKSRKAAGQSRYRLEKKSGISREMIGRVEHGAANPSMCVTAQLCHGMGLTLSEFAVSLDNEIWAQAVTTRQR